ncbi:Piso0_001880 [Millerozyma farinosa CBS 7064]|uniref:Piso0_001880 protein n=1 Tax=Pichia sorbitophila (strain ATCC MYA-4447 / BCRC 22081 / CBS 7064 / NBRC 10061 / NRRL Y-12695) TaxID=559304 RepID=G8YLZ1_PICSO|nr:Piso0_001880 [Millerozyma farinosa CBS 7064]
MLISYGMYTKNKDLLKNYNPDNYLDSNEINETYFMKNLNTRMNYDTLYGIEEYDYECETIVKYRKFSRKEIVDNYDIAKCCFENGDISNLVISKLLACNPDKYSYLFGKYKPFLIYTRTAPLYKYSTFSDVKILKYSYLNSIYIDILHEAIDILVSENSMRIHFIETDKIDIPEYTLYKLAVKYRVKEVEDRIMKLYLENNKKFIKILDMENEKYVYEEISEFPETEFFNPIKGDELNPYSE